MKLRKVVLMLCLVPFSMIAGAYNYNVHFLASKVVIKNATPDTLFLGVRSEVGTHCINSNWVRPPYNIPSGWRGKTLAVASYDDPTCHMNQTYNYANKYARCVVAVNPAVTCCGYPSIACTNGHAYVGHVYRWLSRDGNVCHCKYKVTISSNQ